MRRPSAGNQKPKRRHTAYTVDAIPKKAAKASRTLNAGLRHRQAVGVTGGTDCLVSRRTQPVKLRKIVDSATGQRTKPVVEPQNAKSTKSVRI